MSGSAMPDFAARTFTVNKCKSWLTARDVAIPDGARKPDLADLCARTWRRLNAAPAPAPAPAQGDDAVMRDADVSKWSKNQLKEFLAEQGVRVEKMKLEELRGLAMAQLGAEAADRAPARGKKRSKSAGRASSATSSSAAASPAKKQRKARESSKSEKKRSRARSPAAAVPRIDFARPSPLEEQQRRALARRAREVRHVDPALYEGDFEFEAADNGAGIGRGYSEPSAPGMPAYHDEPAGARERGVLQPRADARSPRGPEPPRSPPRPRVSPVAPRASLGGQFDEVRPPPGARLSDASLPPVETPKPRRRKKKHKRSSSRGHSRGGGSDEDVDAVGALSAGGSGVLAWLGRAARTAEVWGRRVLIAAAVLAAAVLFLALRSPAPVFCDTGAAERDGCFACPRMAACEGGAANCADNYELEGVSCVPQRHVRTMASVMRREALDELAERRGREVCGMLAGGETRFVDVKDLRASLLERYAGRDGAQTAYAEVQNSLLAPETHAVDVMRRGDAVLISSRITRMPLSCRARHFVADNWFEVGCFALVFLLVLYVWLRIRAARARSAQAAEIAVDVLEVVGNARAPQPLSHLREDFPCDDSVWELVIEKMERDSRVRTTEMKVGFEQETAWQWLGTGAYNRPGTPRSPRSPRSPRDRDPIHASTHSTIFS